MTSKKQPQIPGPLVYNIQGTFHVSRELLLVLQIDGGAWAPPKTPQQLWYDHRPIQTMLNARDYRKTPEPPEQGLKPVQSWARHLEQAVLTKRRTSASAEGCMPFSRSNCRCLALLVYDFHLPWFSWRPRAFAAEAQNPITRSVSSTDLVTAVLSSTKIDWLRSSPISC